VDGKEKKCAPYLELPRGEIKEFVNAAEYQNVRILMLAEALGTNYVFPIHGCMGQRGTQKEEERVTHRFKDSSIVFFSKARMPAVPIVKILKKLKVEHLSFVFLVNDKVLRDPLKRMITITTENSQGSVLRQTINKQAMTSDDDRSPRLSSSLPSLPIMEDNSNALLTRRSSLPTSDPIQADSKDLCKMKKRKMAETVSDQLRSLDDMEEKRPLGEERIRQFVGAFSEEQLSLLSEVLLVPLVTQRKRRQMDFQSILEDLMR